MRRVVILLILLIVTALGVSCLQEADGGPVDCAQTCSPLPSQLPAVGDLIEVAPPTAFDAEGPADSARVAWSGSVALAVWSYGSVLFTTRLAPDGAPLDVPPRVVTSDQVANASLVWDGTDFVALWRGVGGGIRMRRIDGGGVPLDGTDAPIVGATGVNGIATASNGETTLVVWWTEASELLGARLGADGTQLDPTPIAIASSAESAVVQWDGAAFVTVYAGSTLGLGASRVSAAGALLDPGGVSIAAAGSRWMSLVGEPGGSVVAWIEASDSASTLYAARLSPALTVVAGPVAVESLAIPSYEITLAAPALSRSEDGGLVIAWTEASDTVAFNTYARALAADLSPLGLAISRPRYGGRNQALVGVDGAHHLAVRTGDRAAAEGLERTPQGLIGGGEEAFARTATIQSVASVAGSPGGYLTAWYEAPASGRRLLARFLGLDGTPLGDGPIELAPPNPAIGNVGPRPQIAWSGSHYLIVGGSGSSSQLSSIAPGALTAQTTVALPLLPQTVALGCGDCSGCLLAWSAPQGILVLRLSAEGVVLDADPRLIAEPPGYVSLLTVLRLGDLYGVFWPKGGLGIDADGHQQPLSGFSSCPGDPGVGGFDGAGGFGGATCAAAFGDGVPIAAGPDTLLAIFRQNGMWAQLLHFDGSDAGRVDADVGWDGPATWDGSAYLLAQGNSCYVVGADSSLQGPGEGLSLDVPLAGVGVLASARPGYSLGVGGVRSAAYGVFRLMAQPLVRPDASACLSL